MGAAYFYHLTEGPMEATLPVLLNRARSAGWRVVVRGSDPARMDWLNDKLWVLGDDSFLPHGLAGGPHDADQPVLLTTGDGLPDAVACLMTIDGASVEPSEVTALDRVCILFDGNDPVMVEAARAQWKALTGAGCAAQYWAQAGGRWEKKAEAG